MPFESKREGGPEIIIPLDELKKFWNQLGGRLDDAQFVEFEALMDKFVAEVQEFVLDALATDDQEAMRALLHESHRWHAVTGSGPNAPEAQLSDKEEKVRREVDKRVTALVARVRREFSLDF